MAVIGEKINNNAGNPKTPQKMHGHVIPEKFLIYIKKTAHNVANQNKSCGQN